MHLTARLCAAAINRSTSYGMIGLGAMGLPMLNNLTNKALLENETASRIIAYDTNSKALQSWREAFLASGKASAQQLVVASSPAEVAEHAAILLTMLPSSPHVREVYTDPRKGIIAGLQSAKEPEPSLLIDCSTCEQAVAIEVANIMKGVGHHMLDAPVSGGTVGATAGTLSFMVGGEKAAFDKAKPTLSLLGSRVVYAGKNGNGLAAKIANNLLLGISMLGTAEAMLLGTRLGLEPALLASILNSSTGKCWSSEVNNPMAGSLEKQVPADRDYSGGFQSKLMAKDLRLALAAADLSKTHLIAGRITSETYDKVEQTDLANKDFSSVLKYLADKSQ